MLVAVLTLVEDFMCAEAYDRVAADGLSRALRGEGDNLHLRLLMLFHPSTYLLPPHPHQLMLSQPIPPHRIPSDPSHPMSTSHPFPPTIPISSQAAATSRKTYCALQYGVRSMIMVVVRDIDRMVLTSRTTPPLQPHFEHHPQHQRKHW